MARTLWWMQALGVRGLPETILSPEAGELALERTVKHDFWAATGFYRQLATGDRVVVKINRREHCLRVPMRWAGRRLCKREKRAYLRLRDLPNVPRYLGDAGDTGFIHAYVDGAPLGKGETIPDDFFDALLALIDALADRGIAYVDTNKPENIILGTDGRPHLIDFQISFDASACWPRILSRRMLATLRQGDVYHCLKHKRRLRPDLLTADERELLERASLGVRIHRRLTWPYFAIRRPVMRWLHEGGYLADAGSN